MARAYDDGLVPAFFRPYAVELAARLAEIRPQRVLELAAGTGVVTQELLHVLPDTEVVATDLSDAMVEVGRANAPGARWQQADAMRLPFDDGGFDAVVCAFGVMFLPDQERSSAEVLRVLRPGGTYLLDVWDSLEHNDFSLATDRAARRFLPPGTASFLAAVPFAFGDPGPLAGRLRAAGFAEVAVETVRLQGPTASIDGLAAAYYRGTPLGVQLADAADPDEVIAAIAEEMRALRAPAPDGSADGALSAHVLMATAPAV
jgi:ubiquinone/menaquinone biosynthesis C-methylase UbiE